MQFTERLAALAAKVRQQRDIIVTEEATKNTFVIPFISTILGYDVFNPLEVVPEFTDHVGINKGAKIDYAIVRDCEVQMLIECKKSAGDLRIEHASQLYRYFSVTDARIAILTNGEVYQFCTDLDAPNRMDSKPFLVLDMNDIDVSASCSMTTTASPSPCCISTGARSTSASSTSTRPKPATRSTHSTRSTTSATSCGSASRTTTSSLHPGRRPQEAGPA